MLPTLQSGEHVLVDTTRRPGRGQLAVVAHPQDRFLMVKRVSSVADDGSVEVLSDHSSLGTDSRHFGPIASADVGGVVCFSLSRMKSLAAA